MNHVPTHLRTLRIVQDESPYDPGDSFHVIHIGRCCGLRNPLPKAVRDALNNDDPAGAPVAIIFEGMPASTAYVIARDEYIEEAQDAYEIARVDSWQIETAHETAKDDENKSEAVAEALEALAKVEATYKARVFPAYLRDRNQDAIIVFPPNAEREMGIEPNTFPKIAEGIRESLSLMAEGDVYGFSLEDDGYLCEDCGNDPHENPAIEGEHIDSCYGFLGIPQNVIPDFFDHIAPTDIPPGAFVRVVTKNVHLNAEADAQIARYVAAHGALLGPTQAQ